MKTATLLFASILIASCSTKTPSSPEVSFAAPQEPLRAPPVPSLCPTGMIEINGDYCPDVKEDCLAWVNREGKATNDAIPEPGMSGRCGVFKFPTRCRTTKVHVHYCIDKFEYPNAEGQIPQSWMTWYDVKNACESQGKRLCTHPEWTFACEGPDMKPYPYGDGYHRDTTSCNTDNEVPENPQKPINKATGKHRKVDVMNVTSKRSSDGQALDSMLIPSGVMKACVSDFGVHDQVGNIDEFIVNESRRPYVSGLVGGHVFGVRNACRPMTEGHGPSFSWYETGGRCCFSLAE